MKKKLLTLTLSTILSICLYGQTTGEIKVVLPGLNEKGEILLNDLLQIKELKTNSVDYNVISFGISFYDKDYTYEVYSNSEKLNEKQIQLLKKIENGQDEFKKVLIENVKIKNSNGEEKILNSFMIMVKKK